MMHVGRFLMLKIRHNRYAFPALYRNRGGNGKKVRMVRKGDIAVIEGYPRSANTFASFAFHLSQNDNGCFGNHLHNPQQFHRAERFGIPALLVIREPRAACTSHMTMMGWSDPLQALDRYIAFHRDLPSNRNAFVVSTFDEVVADFGASIAKLNARFGASFQPFNHSAENEEEIKRRIHESRARALADRSKQSNDPELGLTLPSARKQQKAAELQVRFDNPEVEKALRRARLLYQELTSLA